MSCYDDELLIRYPHDDKASKSVVNDRKPANSATRRRTHSAVERAMLSAWISGFDAQAAAEICRWNEIRPD
jgi:hypothetical protein